MSSTDKASSSRKSFHLHYISCKPACAWTTNLRKAKARHVPFPPSLAPSLHPFFTLMQIPSQRLSSSLRQIRQPTHLLPRRLGRIGLRQGRQGHGFPVLRLLAAARQQRPEPRLRHHEQRGELLQVLRALLDGRRGGGQEDAGAGHQQRGQRRRRGEAVYHLVSWRRGGAQHAGL